MIAAAIPVAFAGETAKAQSTIAEIGKRHPLSTLHQELLIPAVRAAIQMQQKNFTGAIEALRPTERFEGLFPYPAYLRGLCYLKLKSGKEAAAEFQKVIKQPDAFRRVACRHAPMLWPAIQPPAARRTRISSQFGKTPTPTSPS